MKKTGALLAVHALEELGIEYTFGIPGVHNTELYDALGASGQIDPLLVTHESGGGGEDEPEPLLDFREDPLRRPRG